MLLKFEQSEQSIILENREFGYWKITVERPLRLSVNLDKESLERFTKLCAVQNESQLISVINELAEKLHFAKINDYNMFLKELIIVADRFGIKLSAKTFAFIKNNIAVVDQNAEKVIKKIHKAGKATVNRLYGLYDVVIDEKNCIVEYEVDANLRDTEQIPLLLEGGVERFVKDEILSFTPDAWVDDSKTQIGYEISFTKYFYKLEKLRTLEDIKTDIKALEADTDGLLQEIIGW